MVESSIRYMPNLNRLSKKTRRRNRSQMSDRELGSKFSLKILMEKLSWRYPLSRLRKI